MLKNYISNWMLKQTINYTLYIGRQFASKLSPEDAEVSKQLAMKLIRNLNTESRNTAVRYSAGFTVCHSILGTFQDALNAVDGKKTM